MSVHEPRLATCPTHTEVSMLPDNRWVSDEEGLGTKRMMCLKCGTLDTRPTTWQLRNTISIRD